MEIVNLYVDLTCYAVDSFKLQAKFNQNSALNSSFSRTDVFYSRRSNVLSNKLKFN